MSHKHLTFQESWVPIIFFNLLQTYFFLWDQWIQMFNPENLKNKDILLHKHHTGVKMKKFKIETILMSKAQESIQIFVSGSRSYLGSCVFAFSCHVSILSFNVPQSKFWWYFIIVRFRLSIWVCTSNILFFLAITSEGTLSLCAIIDIKFDYLFKMMSARIIHNKAIFPL